MRRITAAALTLTVVWISVAVAGIWWSHSTIYLFGAAVLSFVAAAVWWVWVSRTLDRQLDAHQSSKLPRFLP